jgi:DNA-binding IclR family transcriptional regulator
MADDELNGEKSYSAPALEKGLDILEELEERRGPISVRDLAESLGRSKNEIFRMIHVLISRGYVERYADTEEIALTNKLFGLGLRTPRSRVLLAVALPEMQKLAVEVQQTPHIVIVHRGRTVTLGHIPANSDITFNMNAGYGRLASDATTGAVIMAFQPEAKRQQMFADCDREAGAPIDRAALDEVLADIRARGYVLRKSTDWAGITDVCCPIHDPQGHAIACIIVTVVDRVRQQQNYDSILEALKRTCERIEKGLYPI